MHCHSYFGAHVTVASHKVTCLFEAQTAQLIAKRYPQWVRTFASNLNGRTRQRTGSRCFVVCEACSEFRVKAPPAGSFFLQPPHGFGSGLRGRFGWEQLSWLTHPVSGASFCSSLRACNKRVRLQTPRTRTPESRAAVGVDLATSFGWESPRARLSRVRNHVGVRMVNGGVCAWECVPSGWRALLVCKGERVPGNTELVIRAQFTGLLCMRRCRRRYPVCSLRCYGTCMAWAQRCGDTRALHRKPGGGGQPVTRRKNTQG